MNVSRGLGAEPGGHDASERTGSVWFSGLRNFYGTFASRRGDLPSAPPSNIPSPPEQPVAPAQVPSCVADKTAKIAIIYSVPGMRGSRSRQNPPRRRREAKKDTERKGPRRAQLERSHPRSVSAIRLAPTADLWPANGGEVPTQNHFPRVRPRRDTPRNQKKGEEKRGARSCRTHRAPEQRGQGLQGEKNRMAMHSADPSHTHTHARSSQHP